MLKLFNKLIFAPIVAKSAMWFHSIGLMKNEMVVCGGTEYAIGEFLGFPDEWILDMLKTDGLNQCDIDLTIVFINELRSEWAKIND